MTGAPASFGAGVIVFTFATLLAQGAASHPLPRSGDTEPVSLDGGFVVGGWSFSASGTQLEEAKRSRNFAIPTWLDAPPTRLRATLRPATGADIAILFRTHVEDPAPRVVAGAGTGPNKVFGYGLSINARTGVIGFLRFDGARTRSPGVRTRVPALLTTTEVDVVLLMSGPIFTAFVYDAQSQVQLASLAWSDGTYVDGGPGLYSHRRTPSEVQLALRVGAGTVAAASPVELSKSWLVRVARSTSLPKALLNGPSKRLRALRSPIAEERAYLADEATVRALREQGISIIAQRNIPFSYRNRGYTRRARAKIWRTKAGIRFLDGLKDPALIERHLKKYAARFPKLTRLESIGKSHQGRDIWALSVGKNLDDLSKPALLLCAAHHANEASTPEFVLDAVRFLLEHRAEREVRGWLKDFRIVAVPMVNPDGSHAFWHLGEHLGRNNRRPDPEAENLSFVDFGVDLNRNYPFAWGNVEDRFNSQDPRSRFYRGPSAGSEPEVQALMALAEREHFVSMISFHGAATKILVPYTVDGVPSPTRSAAWPVAEELVAALPHTFAGKSYEAVRNLYPVGGVDQDWYFHRFGTLAYLVEVPATIPSRRRPLAEMLKHTRPAWQTLLRRFQRGPSLDLLVLDADGAPVAAEVVILEIGPKANERWMNHPQSGRFFSYLPDAGVWTVRVQAGDERVERRIKISAGSVTHAVIRFAAEAD